MSCRLLTIPSSAMTSDQSNAVIALCSEVFELDYAYYMNLCPDRVHVLGYVDSQLVAHALWLDRPLRAGYGPWLNSAYVEGVATHADQRGRGYGAAVMRRLQAEGPLWIEHNGALEATPDDEMVLIYRTPRTPQLDLAASLTAPWRPFELW